MDFERYLRYLQELIGYEFKNPSLLALALTAAGAEGNADGDDDERTKYDGNRRLALYGGSIAQTIIIGKTLFEEDRPDRDRADKALKSAKLKEHMEERAKRFQLDTHMKLNIRQKGQAARGTLSTTINAIFGACYLDSDDISAVRGVIEKFGLGVDNEHYTDPKAAYDQLYVFGGEVTDGIFDNESLTNIDNTIDPSSTDMTIMQNADLIMAQEMDDIFGPLPRHSGSVISDGFGNTRNGDPQPEINWNESEFPLSLRGSAASSVATSGGSQTIMGNDEESFPGVQNTRNTGIDGSIIVVEDSANHRDPQVNPGDTERQSSVRGPGRMASGNISAKRKYTTPSKTKATQLDKYVSDQKELCQKQGLPCPEESFNAVITSPAASDRLREMIPELKLLYFAIASPESVAVLQANVKVGKRDGVGGLKIPQWDLPVPKRMMAIEGLGQNMSYMALIRRCHIHQLYVDSSVGNLKTSDGFILNTPETILSRPSSAFGNPINLEDSRVSAMIMREVYPDLEPASPGYQKKLRFAKKMRKLGQRLDIFVTLWGYGIIGLLPFAKDIWDVDTGLDITDNFILKFPHHVFEEFVQSFNQIQGNFLREMSAAVSEIVKAISRGRIDPSARFGIETLKQEQILNEPRGSRSILESILSITPHL